MKLNIKPKLSLVGQAFKRFFEDRGLSLAAGLAYYTIFSIAPLLLISIAIAGFVFGDDASRGGVFRSLQGLFGPDGARAVESMVEVAGKKENSGIWATVVGILTLIIGSTGAFAELQDSLNLIWRVRAKPGHTVGAILRQRLLSLSLVMVIGFLLLVSLVVSAALSAAGNYLTSSLPGGELLWQSVNFVISLGAVTVLFAGIYKILPDVKLKWRDVMVAGLTTAVLFTIGKTLIGLYLGHSSVASAYGAAGSAAVILIWAYYSAVILFLGAEVSRAIVMSRTLQLELKRGAEWIPAIPAEKGRPDPAAVAVTPVVPSEKPPANKPVVDERPPPTQPAPNLPRPAHG